MDAVVVGNVTLDILCYPVSEVPRYDSISFERAQIGPGGCGSNVALGLRALGVSTALVARVGSDEAYGLVERYWEKAGLDRRFVRRDAQAATAVSVGLVDAAFQPRFIHTPGANRQLNVDDIDVNALEREGARALAIAGYFVLPGLMDSRLAGTLQAARSRGMFTCLDVVHSPNMEHPEPLWPCLPHLDYFLCNTMEGQRLTGAAAPREIGRILRQRGAQAVIVKLGAEGCWVDSPEWQGQVPGLQAQVVDTTGAGDAFAAGLIAALLRQAALPAACAAANAAGARIVARLGTVAAWFE